MTLYRRLLVPLDGSGNDEAVLFEARRIAPPGGGLHLLHVVPSVTPPVGMDPTRLFRLHEQALEYLEVDVIAMTTHGRTGLDHAVVGSVAESVLRDTDRPVILQKALKPSHPDPRSVRSGVTT